MEREEGGDGGKGAVEEDEEEGLVWRCGEDFTDGLWVSGAVFFGALVACWEPEQAYLAWFCYRCLNRRS